MSKNFRLPHPEAPTVIREDDDSYHPKYNVFKLMPVRQLGKVGLEATVNVNLATFYDPYDRRQQTQYSSYYVPWLQGALMQFDQLEIAHWPVRTDERRGNRVRPYSFAGTMQNRDEAPLPVVGAVRSDHPGWIAFESDIGLPRPEDPTIADLKALIGQIGWDHASYQNYTHETTGYFDVRGELLV